jgi:Cupredoxin-like domain
MTRVIESLLARPRARFDGTVVAGLVSLLASGLLIAGQASAGDVRGSVRSTEEVKAKNLDAVRAPYWQEWNGFIDPKKATVDYPREVSAVLIGPVGSKDAITVALRDGTLTPSTVVVPMGTTLRIRNDDDFAHELYVPGLKGFDAVETSPGATRTIQMEQTGTFALQDRLAPYVHGSLHVIAKLTQVANPGTGGDFAFKDVPPGNYTLKVFRADKEVSSEEIEVGSRELTLDAVSVDAKPGK